MHRFTPKMVYDAIAYTPYIKYFDQFSYLGTSLIDKYLIIETQIIYDIQKQNKDEVDI